ncbi:MAG: ATP-dependent helicase [Candidatus Limnocylindrales bacterium]
MQRAHLPEPVAARLARLAPDQRAAATAPPGPVLCVAPAGSGKTTTVVARLAWRVATGAEAATICALTFNRAAAEELQQRADAALAELGHPDGTVRVRTFHALGREILADAGLDVTRVVDRPAVIEELAGGPLPAAQLRHLDDAFSRLKLDPERGPPRTDGATHAAFAAYQQRLRREGAIDLDDLVALAAPRLEGDAPLLARWRARTAVLFVDEAQDLDKSQLDLALLLAGPRRDLFAVGDDDQTIYAWRLADVRRVLGLAARLPGLRRVDLQTNHRCAPEVVRRAARLVEHNEERFDKRILASPRNSGSVYLLPDPGDEVTRARLLLERWATEPSGERHAVLARTNRELVPFAALALELGMPYRVQEDGLRWPDGSMRAALAAADTRLPLLVAVQRAANEARLAPEATADLLAWAAGSRDLEELRATIEARIEAQADLRRDDAILTLATAHGTKGLEWDHVACIGHDEGAFPSGRALREAEDPKRVLEEERRLAYVAWTRARRTLTIVYDPGAPSTFVLEAFDPAELP